MSFTQQELQQIKALTTERLNYLEQDRSEYKSHIRSLVKRKQVFKADGMKAQVDDFNKLIRGVYNRLDSTSEKIAKLVDLQKKIKIEQQRLSTVGIIQKAITKTTPSEWQDKVVEDEPAPKVNIAPAISWPFPGKAFGPKTGPVTDQLARGIQQPEVRTLELRPSDTDQYWLKRAEDARDDGYVSDEAVMELAATIDRTRRITYDENGVAKPPAFKFKHPGVSVTELDNTAKPTNPKDAIGSNKLPLHLWPATATAMGCLGFLNGMLKYGRANFRVHGIRASIYIDAAKRHLDAWFEGEECDPDDGVPHLAAALACIGIVVDAIAADKLNDDRQVKGGYRKMVEELTPHVARLKALHEGKTPRHYTIADVV